MNAWKIGIFFIFLFGFFVGQNVLAAGPTYCFYFKNGSASSQCLMFNIKTNQPDTDFQDTCKAYTNYLKTGEAYPENLYGWYQPKNSDPNCPVLPNSKEDTVTVFKYSNSSVTINGLTTLISDGQHGLLFIGNVLAKSNGFTQQMQAALSIQDQVNFEDEKAKLVKLLTDYFTAQEKNFCCIAALGGEADLHYSCAAPSGFITTPSGYVDTFVDSMDDSKKALFKADDVFEFIKKDLTKDKLHGFFSCSAFDSSKQNLFDYACNNKSVFITVPGTESKPVPFNGTPGDICGFKDASSAAGYKGIPFTIPPTGELNQIGTLDPKILLGRGIQTILGILGSISLVMFVYGGILYMTDMGNSERAEKAKQIFIWNSLGLVVIFSSYAIIKMILEAFN